MEHLRLDHRLSQKVKQMVVSLKVENVQNVLLTTNDDEYKATDLRSSMCPKKHEDNDIKASDTIIAQKY